MIAKSHRWQKTVMAAAATALINLYAPHASALSLGRITVQSALGEPLRAEVDIPEITSEEASTLKTGVALPAAFQSAGLEYNPAMASLKTSLQMRANGRAFLKLSSDRAINEPFVDMILEATWSSGRIVRDYTMLFDPPALKQATPSAVMPAQTAPAPSSVRPAQATPVPMRAPTPAATPSATAPSADKRQAPPAARPAAAPAGSTSQRVTVQSGDTASKIANDNKSVNVSLDQMLLAMLRANPDAFIRDNVNRIKAGAVLNLPSAEQASATSPEEASQIIVAQSRDFNDYRRKLADDAPVTPMEEANRQASGKLQAQVDDKKPAAVAPDKLTLSKGTVQAQLAEEQLAKERSAVDAASRAAEIAKNIRELSQLEAVSSGVATAPIAAASGAAPALAEIASTTPALPPASEAAPPAPPAAPAQTVAAAPKPPEPAPAPEPGLMDELMENPLLPASAAALIALLAGLGYYRVRQRKLAAQMDSSFMESHLKPESFFGASGGQSVDTSDNSQSGSSMVYSPSQLVADDVDPVAEADVYLAYGRDLQAEEILKEALRTNPKRMAIHQKLADIYAKRQDAKGLASVATLGFQITGGVGTEWERLCELGLSIDPDNALYQPGGHPPPSLPESPAEALAESKDEDQSSEATQDQPAAEGPPSDLDLDLDFSLDDEPASLISQATPSAPAPLTPQAELEAANAPASLDALDLDFDFPASTLVQPDELPAETLDNSIDFTLPEIELTPDALDEAAESLSLDTEDFKVQAATSFGTTEPAPLLDSDPESEVPTDMSMLDFDLDKLSLDLDDTPVKGATPAPEPSLAPDDLMDLATEDDATPIPLEDALATKLALAEEFSAIGDDDGARALIEEVIAEATGDMKTKAQRALNNL